MHAPPLRGSNPCSPCDRLASSATAALDLWLGRALLCRAEVDRPLQKLVPTLIRAGLERRAERSDWLRLAPP